MKKLEKMISKKLKGGRIRIARSEMDYTHKGETITSVYPLEGPENFREVMSVIRKENLLRATTAQSFSLLDFLLSNLDNKQCKYLFSKIDNRGLWTSTEELWCKNEVIIYDNAAGKMPSSRLGLIKRMEEGDKAVRIVPYGFEIEEQSISDFVRNPYVIGQVGDKDFAQDVVARVIEKESKDPPYLSLCDLDDLRTGRSKKTYVHIIFGWDIHGLTICHTLSEVDDIGEDQCYASAVVPKSED